ncbi:MAG TPA: M56 family metallopeptidase [Actinocatenispora sp.]
MTMPVTAAALALLAVVLLGPVSHLLPRARWAVAEPRATLVLWQAIGLSAGLAALGAVAAVAVAPLSGTLFGALRRFAERIAAGEPTGGLGPVHTVLLLVAVMLGARLVGVLALSAWRTVRARGRHRRMVDLIGRPLTADRDGLVLDHPAPAAYCLPGGAPRVVLTSGALALFDDAELAAVLAHERAHLAERHDLVVLPFAAWSAALPWLSTVRRSRAAVDGLVEMVADDRACLHADRTVLACALARFGAAGVPAGALAATGTGTVLTRVRRLLDPPPRSRRLRYALIAVAATLLLLPTAALLLA